MPRQSGVAGGLSPAWLQALIQALQVQACSPLTGYTPAIITPAELSPAAGDPGATPLSLASPASGQVSCLTLGLALGAGAVAGPRAMNRKPRMGLEHVMEEGRMLSSAMNLPGQSLQVRLGRDMMLTTERDAVLGNQGVGASGAPYVQRKQALGPGPELRRALLLAAARHAAVQAEVRPAASFLNPDCGPHQFSWCMLSGLTRAQPARMLSRPGRAEGLGSGVMLSGPGKVLSPAACGGGALGTAAEYDKSRASCRAPVHTCCSSFVLWVLDLAWPGHVMAAAGAGGPRKGTPSGVSGKPRLNPTFNVTRRDSPEVMALGLALLLKGSRTVARARQRLLTIRICTKVYALPRLLGQAGMCELHDPLLRGQTYGLHANR